MSIQKSELKSGTVHIRFLTVEDAEAMLHLQLENKAFFEKTSAERKSEFYTLEGTKERIASYGESAEKDEDYFFGIFKNDDGSLIGTINLFAVMRGSIQSAFTGYALDEKHNGKGLMTEALKLIIDYGFNELKLHRLEAGVMPHNMGSLRVLEKAGFEREGYNRKNVKINGQWEDHVHLAIVNPND
ncbi:GNAT family N-acetyltransferase [Fictibacillus aquaticus]|uniref:RimJ/RimL family protein N-acetyltransferase n=1 Tax=Fictibacillus aquaticus TaxID=2021314 RepID=A0A235FDC8_9BACL|nr:GNAT family protein [Fictibacillus aquaticus]OYD59410.1 RimJ/RimL family protein N-acetyltransferase [Fictibacillus aquaticus]